MNRSHRISSLHLTCACALALIFVASIGAAGQTTPATPALTPAQQKAQAAREARQAAAQQAAQNRAAAAQAKAAAAQNKKAANTTAPNTATNPLTNGTTAAGSAGRNGTLPGATNPGTTTNPATAQKNMGSGTVGSGTLAWGTRVYSSTGCQHNGNSAVCTFTFTNQGNEANLVAGSELQGIQLVDDAHVPHHADSAHFMDKYGTQQPRLLVQPGDTGTYVLTFPNVNSQVSSADFHLRQQIVGGVTFSSTASTASATPAAPTTPARPTPK